MIVLIGIVLFISSLFSAQMDTIKFRPMDAWFQSDWWLGNDWKRAWAMKVPLSFLLDGWHFCKMVMLVTVLYPTAIYLTTILQLNFWYSVLIDVLIYALYGIVFEIFYGKKL